MPNQSSNAVSFPALLDDRSTRPRLIQLIPRIVATADNSSGTVSIWNTGDQKAALKVLNVPGVIQRRVQHQRKTLSSPLVMSMCRSGG